MAFFDYKELKNVYELSKQEANVWKEDYPQFRRLMDNGLMDQLDPNLPEVNDGSLSAALFKLPKRVVSGELSGTVKAIDRDEAWLSELANMQWRNEIIPNANTQAPFIRKWKNAVRNSAGFGGTPLITIFVDKDGKRHADFIEADVMDVTLEAGKVSDYDSDVIFWDIYLSELQLKNMIEQAKAEQKEAKDNDKDSYNKWNIPGMQRVLDSKAVEEQKGNETTSQKDNKPRKKGYKFNIAFQRGVDAPFYMCHPSEGKPLREWTNPDPTGDLPVHYLYCYQDMVNPYGIGIVKLAGGTQNVLDYMRQADVLATQLGIRPPINVGGDADSADIDSLVYTQDALWFTGNAVVKREELANGVYNQLPGRIQMYQASLQKLIPTGDTSISGENSGDPTMSKTPAGVKLAAANLSIDDEDFKDNLYITYEAVARSMINTQFANMEGTDLMKLSDDERDILMKAGLEFPEDENGQPSNQLEIVWDTVRAQFNFEVDPEQDKTKDDAEKLDGLTKIADFISNPAIQQLAMGGQPIILGTKKLNIGELLSDIIGLTTDNDKILTDVTPDEMAQTQQDMLAQQAQASMPMEQPQQSQHVPEQLPQQPLEQPMPEADPEQMQPPEQMSDMDPEMQANVQAVMQEHGVDEMTAITALAAEAEGFPPEDVIAHMQSLKEPQYV